MKTLSLPGLIDPHVHLRDPGQTAKEDFYTGTAAALAGGFTTVLDMPNTVHPITNQERLEGKKRIAKEKIVCDIGFYFGSLGDNIDEFKKVSSEVFGLKIFLNQTTGGFVLDPTKLETIFLRWPENRPILFHAEDRTFDTVLQVLKKHPRKIHLCHLSTRYELQQVIKAKEQGFHVTCGVTPHHLFLTNNDEKTLGPLGKMRPPLQSGEDVDFLWKHLSAIDVIESDHAPHTLQEKQSVDAPNGIPGLETTLPLLLTAVSENRLTIDDIVRLCHTNPAEIFGMQTDEQTRIEVDTDEMYEIKNQELQTKSKWTPFNGRKVKGKIKRVFLRGEKVFENGEIIVEAGSAHVIKPSQ